MGPQLAVGRERGDVPTRRRRRADPARDRRRVVPVRRAARRRPPLPGPVLAREGRRPGDRGGPPGGSAARPRGQGRRRRRGPLRRGDRAADRRRPDPLRRRGRRRPEAPAPRRRPGAAVPDRVGRAVRARDDRGDGLRHAGHRPAACERAGGRRPGRHWLRRGRRRGPGPGDRPRRRDRPTSLPAPGRGAVRRRADGRRLRADVRRGHRERRRRAGRSVSRSAERHRLVRGGRRPRCTRVAVA